MWRLCRRVRVSQAPLLVLAFAPFLFSCNRERLPYERTEFLFGTVCVIKSDARNVGFVFDWLREQEGILSPYLAESAVSEINENAGIRPVKVSDEVYALLEEAVGISAETGGCFNPLIGAVTSLWVRDGGFSRLPDETEIAAALPLTDIGDMELSDSDRTVFLTRKGMRLDLGGIAKGYLADKAASMLRDRGVKNYLVNLGGDIVVSAGDDFTIGIQNPDGIRGNAAEYLKLNGKAVVTSGAYERNFTEGGVFYHHILDPATGFPCEVRNKSVTVVCESCMVGDAWATALFVNPGLLDEVSSLRPDVSVTFR